MPTRRPTRRRRRRPAAILLAGDSQFDRWKTFKEDLPGYTVINRGIDSFRTDDLIQYVDRLVIRYRPRLVVLHVGGNDIHRARRRSSCSPTRRR